MIGLWVFGLAGKINECHLCYDRDRVSKFQHDIKAKQLKLK